ncbi:MAG: hypothetical protein JSV65_16665 [Armatimonadota bacterium]|nr:MAG: hypothetical protein JSV65_16665 [Armatimonadota bacterium]
MMAIPAGAEQIRGGERGPERVELKLDRCRLVWRAQQGLDVERDGMRVFSAYPQEFTLHTRDWKKAHFDSSRDRGRARLARRGAAHVLTIEHAVPGFRWTERIVAGPGDRFRFECEYVQDAWDDAALQLGFSRPTEHWFAGAAFESDAAAQRADGIIPLSFDPAQPHPFTGASDITISSLFGRVEIAASKPITLYDYDNRWGHFWLGLDEDLPKGEERSFAIEVRLSPAVVAQSGLRLSAFHLPAEVGDGRLAASFAARAESAAAERVSVTLSATSPRGERLEATTNVRLHRDRDTPVALSLPAVTPGAYAYRVIVSARPGRAELFATKELTAQVLPVMTLLPGRSIYTSEETGCLLVGVSDGLAGETLRFIASADNGLRIEADVRGGARNRVEVNLARLPNGVNQFTGELRRGEEVVAIAETVLRTGPPKANEVGIDYENRGLIVDGLPWFPFGFYCIFPPGELPAAEAPQGFNMIAAYQNAARDPAQVRAYLDRCAEVGMKVHYDIRAIAQAEPSPEKWEALRREVEAYRDHPALLAWYLCDEPDGQGIPPERLIEAYNFVKELDPYHPITMVFCIPARAPEYVSGMDIMMADPYPIPHGSVTVVAEWADQLNRAVGYGMPLWIVPQAFGGGEGWRREPTAREERAMTYLALVHGATGIQYFIRRPPIGNPISPSLWSECRRLALEAQELTPVLLSTEPAPAVTTEVESVHVAAWRWRGSVYVIAVNAAVEPVTAALAIEEDLSGEAEVLFEGRRVAVTDGGLHDMIDGFGTRVYRVEVEAPAEAIAVAPGNLTVNPSFEDSANVGTPDGCYVTVGSDPGASLFVDSRVAYHGAHSLRLRTPTEGGGVTVVPFPVVLESGREYVVSVWAKAQTAGLRFALGLRGIAAEPQTFELGTEWARYEFAGVAENDARTPPTLELISPGTAWFDVLEVVPQ